MDINAALVDQYVRQIAEKYPDRLPGQGDAAKQRSAAFVVLCARTMLDLDDEEALDALTEGGADAGMDAVIIGDLLDGEFVVTLLQGKYKQSLDGDAGFPANAIGKAIGTIGAMFDPGKALAVNPKLSSKITDIRGLILDGNLPVVRVLFCNNGRTWEADGQNLIDASGFPPDRVRWEHVSHNKIVDTLRRRESVNERIRCSGKAIVEDLNFLRVFVGKVPVAEVARIFASHGDMLLERNIRRYLGMRDNRVNAGIHQTLTDPSQRPNFYVYNNGITAVCSKFTHNALQATDYQVLVENFQIINGGQTCKTIQETLEGAPGQTFDDAFVLLRLYQLPGDSDDLVAMITHATNSQNPVDLGDLRSNDEVQQRLGMGIEKLGFEYRTKRDDRAVSAASVITSNVVAEAVMATWRRKPHAAKFRRRRLFGDLYDEIFTADLNAAQAVVAVLVFRFVENERRRPTRTSPPEYLPYASHFLAMLVGQLLLAECGLAGPRDLTHLTFQQVREYLDGHRDALYDEAVARLDNALNCLGVPLQGSLPRLAASFRRGDLLEELGR